MSFIAFEIISIISPIFMITNYIYIKLINRITFYFWLLFFLFFYDKFLFNWFYFLVITFLSFFYKLLNQILCSICKNYIISLFFIWWPLSHWKLISIIIFCLLIFWFCIFIIISLILINKSLISLGFAKFHILCPSHFCILYFLIALKFLFIFSH